MAEGDGAANSSIHDNAGSSASDGQLMRRLRRPEFGQKQPCRLHHGLQSQDSANCHDPKNTS